MNTTTTHPNTTLDLGIGGMTCASCVMRVEKALKKVPGVQEASVNLATESARVRFEPAPQLEAQLRRAVRNAGYEPRAADAAQSLQDASPWAGFAPVAVGLVLSTPLVLPMLGELFGQHWMLPAWLQFLLATPVQFILGGRFYVGGWHALKARSGTMDLLVSTPLTICGEVVLSVRQNLMAKNEAAPGSFTRVYSHSQSLGQWPSWLAMTWPSSVRALPSSAMARRWLTWPSRPTRTIHWPGRVATARNPPPASGTTAWGSVGTVTAFTTAAWSPAKSTSSMPTW